MDKTIFMKGLSPIIAVVLLIAIAVTISVILNAWSQLIITRQTNDAGNKTTQVTGCENVEIEQIYIDFPGNRTRVFIRSSGDTYAASITLLNTTGGTGNNVTQLPFYLPKGQLVRFEFSNQSMVSCSAFGKVIVTTSCITEESSKVTGCT